MPGVNLFAERALLALVGDPVYGRFATEAPMAAQPVVLKPLLLQPKLKLGVVQIGQGLELVNDCLPAPLHLAVQMGRTRLDWPEF